MVDDRKQKGGLDIIQTTVAIAIGLLFKLPLRSLFVMEQEIENISSGLSQVPLKVWRELLDEEFNSIRLNDGVVVCLNCWAPREYTIWVNPELTDFVICIFGLLFRLVCNEDGIAIWNQIIKGTLWALRFALGAVVFGCSIARFSIGS